MGSIQNPVGSLLNTVLESYREEHGALSEIWRSLDAKSQGIIAIDGIFIAAMFAFVMELSSSTTCGQKWMLSAAALLLTISVILSIIALWVRSIPSAPIGKAHEVLVQDLLTLQDGIEQEHLHNLSRDHMELWYRVNSEIHGVIKSKAELLIASQISLVVAILVVVLHVSLTIWS